MIDRVARNIMEGNNHSYIPSTTLRAGVRRTSYKNFSFEDEVIENSGNGRWRVLRNCFQLMVEARRAVCRASKGWKYSAKRRLFREARNISRERGIRIITDRTSLRLRSGRAYIPSTSLRAGVLRTKFLEEM